MIQDWVADVVIEEILHAFPEQIAERRRKLADSDWCARHPQAVRDYHNPHRAHALVRVLHERSNPYSHSSLARHAAEAESRMINTSPSYTYVLRDPDTGEVIDEEIFVNDVDPADPFVRSYVADLN
jgi:hypothetical protein